MLVECIRERIEVEAGSRVDGNLHCAQIEPFYRLKRRIKTRRLDSDDVAGTRHCHQAKVQCLKRAVGHDDIFDRLRDTHPHIAQGDLASQVFIARRQIDDRALWAHQSGSMPEHRGLADVVLSRNLS
jgi:hypothetical protein